MIFMKDGVKMMRPVLNREEYIKLRNGGRQKSNVAAVRSGDEKRKSKLVQMNYSCLPNDDGTLKGSTRMTTTVGMDIDHVKPTDMQPLRERILAKKDELGLLMLELSARAQGYHLVFRRKPELSQEENLKWASELLNVDFDKGAKDITRVFYTTTGSAGDLLFLDDEIFEIKEGVREEKEEVRSQTQEEQETLTYHGIEYGKICEAWQTAQGGAPAPGDRHRTMLQLALDLRYICDNQPDMVDRVLRLCGFVQDVIRERGDKEVSDIAHTACERKLYKDIPKRMQGVLESVGIHVCQPTAAARAVGGVEVPYEQFAERLEPLLCTPYAEACRGVSRSNWLGAVFASGAMYCTLLTRCWYKHFDGAMQRMNPQVLIIGHPASGKSFAKHLDDQIMASMRAQDEEVRLAETRYKQEQKKRGTSSKAQKQDALVEPEGMIRYLPTKTSNNIFFRRLKRAKELVDGELLPLHLYMFDSELDSSISAQSGGAWIGKHDLELKAFHNELSGVDYANGDSINDILPVYWNSVTTGTNVSLHKKFTLRNINDGLCSRVAIFLMERANFQMVRKNVIDWKTNEELKAWGFKMEQLHGELPLERLVDHVYSLCELSAQEAEAAGDLVLDYLRKRAVFYATWFTVPRILARQYDTFRKTGMLDITDDDLKFATLIYDAVIWFQDYFFGQMLQDSWDNAEREYVPRRRNTKNADAYRDLPDTFTAKDVMAVLDIERNTASQQCNRWLMHGFVERIKQGKYKKVMKEIMI